MGTVIEFSEFAGLAHRPERDNVSGKAADIVIFPGIRIDYDTPCSEDHPSDPRTPPRRARRSKA